MIMKQMIGNVTLKYREDGSLEGYAFVPTLELRSTEPLESEIPRIACSTDSEAIRKTAETVLAKWFMALTDIELADRDHYAIKAEVTKCDKWANNMVKECDLAFSFSKI